MRHQYLFILFSFFITLILSCDNNADQKKALNLKERELELKERKLSLMEKEISNNGESSSSLAKQKSISSKNNMLDNSTKFVFILIETNEPTLEEKEIPNPQKSIYDGGNIPYAISKSYKIVIPKYYSYKSDIVEVQNFTEDKKFIVMDKFENSILLNLIQVNSNLKMNNNSGLSEPAPYAVASIVNRKAYISDSYSIASEKRNKLK